MNWKIWNAKSRRRHNVYDTGGGGEFDKTGPSQNMRRKTKTKQKLNFHLITTKRSKNVRYPFRRRWSPHIWILRRRVISSLLLHRYILFSVIVSFLFSLFSLLRNYSESGFCFGFFPSPSLLIRTPAFFPSSFSPSQILL